MSILLTVSLSLLAGAAFFVLLWSGITTALSKSGWSQLARHYASTGHPVVSWKLRLAYIGMTSYRNALTMGVSEEGLSLVPSPLFARAHPELLIPWTELKVGEARKFTLQPLIELRFKSEPEVCLALKKQDIERLLEEAQEQGVEFDSGSGRPG